MTGKIHVLPGALVEEPFFTVGELAKKLAISEATVRRLLRDGELPWYAVGGQRRIDPADVQSWLDAHKRWGLQ